MGRTYSSWCWENGEDIKRAQLKLLEKFSLFAGIKPGIQILDVGCGVGSSAIWLSANYKVSVQGISISPVQIRIAFKKSKNIPGLNFSIMDGKACYLIITLLI